MKGTWSLAVEMCGDICIYVAGSNIEDESKNNHGPEELSQMMILMKHASWGDEHCNISIDLRPIIYKQLFL